MKSNTVFFSAVVFSALLAGIASGYHVITPAAPVKWQPVTVSFHGPVQSETDPATFTDFRLSVTFTNGANSYTVPGFFAADGNAANTGAQEGGVWQAHFSPDKAGEWSFTASFRTGPYVSVSVDPEAGDATSFDGEEGSFTVGTLTGDEQGNLARGWLQHAGGNLFQFRQTKEFFLKHGISSPSNILAYGGFDNTPASHSFAAHAGHWNAGDPDWTGADGGDGKALIGALNYLAGQGVNSVYMDFNNIGVGDDVFPWQSADQPDASAPRQKFDISKLAQWEIVFSHMDRLGMEVHAVLSKRDNQGLFEYADSLPTGAFSSLRMLFYREMVARFGHHMAVSWNIGEQNGEYSMKPQGRSTGDQQRAQFLLYIATLDPYDHPTGLGTPENSPMQVARPLLGTPNLDFVSISAWPNNDLFDYSADLRSGAAEAGRPIVVYLDRIINFMGPDLMNISDPAKNEWEYVRKVVLWKGFRGLAGGVSWHFQNFGDELEDFSTLETVFSETNAGMSIFRDSIPYLDMEYANQIVSQNTYAFALANKDRSLIAVYMESNRTSEFKLTPRLILLDGFGETGEVYNARWFNARDGGELIAGTPPTLPANAVSDDIGAAPDTTVDWLIILEKVIGEGKVLGGPANTASVTVSSSMIHLNLDKGAFVKISLREMNGKMVRSLCNSENRPGEYFVPVPVKEVAKGLYFLDIQINGEQFTRKFVNYR